MFEFHLTPGQHKNSQAMAAIRRFLKLKGFPKPFRQRGSLDKNLYHVNTGYFFLRLKIMGLVAFQSH